MTFQRRLYTINEKRIWNRYLASVGEDEIPISDDFLWDTFTLQNWEQVTFSGNIADFFPPQTFLEQIGVEVPALQSTQP